MVILSANTCVLFISTILNQGMMQCLHYNYIKFVVYSLLQIWNFEKFFDVIQLKMCGKIFFLLNFSSLTKPNYLPLSLWE